MSAHGRSARDPGRRPGGRPPQLIWALLVIAAALIGGLAAVAIVHTNLAVAMIVAVVAGVIAVAAFWSPSRPAERPAPERGPMPPAARIPPAAVTVAGPAVPPGPAGPAGPAPGQPETAVQLLPLPGGNSSRQGAPQSWWDAAQGAPPAPSAGAQRVPAPDLSTYLASTFIAQCPRCGAFRLDIREAADGWSFRCESCEYAWTWQPGTPWPPVRVMPGRRRPLRPPSF